MDLRGTVCLLIAAALSGTALHAQNRVVAQELSADAADTGKALGRTALLGTASGSGYEVHKNVTVAVGKTVVVDSSLDFSSAASAAVTVYCANCSTATTSLGSLPLVLQAFWSVPDAASFVATDSKSSFLYYDSGAALFQVYGSQFRLVLQNKGSSNVTLNQLTIFRRTQ